MTTASGTVLRQNLDYIQEQFAAACAVSGRKPEELTLIAVTKFHPTSLVRELWDLGVRNIGENKHQEASSKAAELAELDGLKWHYIGQLQTNKARQVAQYASAVHSVDRVRLVDALAVAPRSVPLDVFLQVNLTDDTARGGVDEAGFELLAESVLQRESLNLCGVMAVAPLHEPARGAFAKLRGFSERLQKICPEATAISAGMSHDFREAIAEGATHLRIGSSITGNRPNPK